MRRHLPMKELGLFGVRAEDGAALTADELLGELAGAEVVCVGEDPRESYHHQMALAVFSALLERARASGRELGVGLSMLSLDQQRFLNAFVAGRLKLRDFEGSSRWAASTDLPFRFFAPLLAVARGEGAALIALNVRRDLEEKVAAEGIHGLSPEERRRLPELGAAQAYTQLVVGQRGGPPPPPGSGAAVVVEAELVSEETMAETAASWLSERRPLRQLVIVAGIGQCRQTAVPGRIRRRLVDASVLSALPVLDHAGDPPGVADGYDYALVLTADRGLTGTPE